MGGSHFTKDHWILGEKGKGYSACAQWKRIWNEDVPDP